MEVSTTTKDNLNGVVVCEDEMVVNIPSIEKTLKLTLIQVPPGEIDIWPTFSVILSLIR